LVDIIKRKRGGGKNRASKGLTEKCAKSVLGVPSWGGKPEAKIFCQPQFIIRKMRKDRDPKEE